VLANDVCFVIFSAEDAFREILDEVEVFSPCRENVLLADLSTHLVGIVVMGVYHVPIASPLGTVKSFCKSCKGFAYISSHRLICTKI